VSAFYCVKGDSGGKEEDQEEEGRHKEEDLCEEKDKVCPN
jgi:hypothetical protein